MNPITRICITAAFGLMCTSAMAANGTISIKDLPDGGEVSLTGTVDAIDNEREFTLRDSTGAIDVEIKSAESVVLKKGDKVSVSGTIDKGLTSTEIDAKSVVVHKNISETIGEAIEGSTGVSIQGAESYHINNLPKEGMVKISGTVTEVDSEKEFTLKDSTGSIDIDVESSEAAALTKGAQVTVIGYVDNGMLGKDINATKVLVQADAVPVVNSNQ